nr:hypothetical protein [Acetobacter nitrogenifigens]
MRQTAASGNRLAYGKITAIINRQYAIIYDSRISKSILLRTTIPQLQSSGVNVGYSTIITIACQYQRPEPDLVKITVSGNRLRYCIRVASIKIQMAIVYDRRRVGNTSRCSTITNLQCRWRRFDASIERRCSGNCRCSGIGVGSGKNHCVRSVLHQISTSGNIASQVERRARAGMVEHQRTVIGDDVSIEKASRPAISQLERSTLIDIYRCSFNSCSSIKN